jgi:hypothetical protein
MAKAAPDCRWTTNEERIRVDGTLEYFFLNNAPQMEIEGLGAENRNETIRSSRIFPGFL